MNNTLSTTKFFEMLEKTVPAKLPVLAISEPGMGKSSIFKQVAEKLGYQFKALHPATLDPVDVSGMPIPVTSQGIKKIERMLDDYLASIFETKENTLLLLDELGQASPAMQAACAPLILDRRIGNHVLPDCVTISAATNSRKHRAGASNILSHLISRMACVVNLEIEPDGWYDWAVRNGVRHEIISFLRFRPGLLHDFDAEKAFSETSAYPCPRAWYNLSMLMDAGLPPSVEIQAFSGTVGAGAATEFYSHLKVVRELPDIDTMLDNPSMFSVPERANTRWAVATGVALRCNETNRSNVLQIIEMMHDQKAGEYAAVALKDAFKVDGGLQSSAAFSAFFGSSKAAQMMMRV